MTFSLLMVIGIALLTFIAGVIVGRLPMKRDQNRLRRELARVETASKSKDIALKDCQDDLIRHNQTMRDLKEENVKIRGENASLTEGLVAEKSVNEKALIEAIEGDPDDENQRGYKIFRKSDALVRALKKVLSARDWNRSAKKVNNAIDAGDFDKWTNPPNKVKLKEE